MRKFWIRQDPPAPLSEFFRKKTFFFMPPSVTQRCSHTPPHLPYSLIQSRRRIANRAMSYLKDKHMSEVHTKSSTLKSIFLLKTNQYPVSQEACIDYICDNIESICNPITAEDGEKRLQFKEEEVSRTTIIFCKKMPKQ